MSYKYYNDFIYNKKIPYNIITQFDALGYDRFLQDINVQLEQFMNSMP